MKKKKKNSVKIERKERKEIKKGKYYCSKISYWLTVKCKCCFFLLILSLLLSCNQEVQPTHLLTTSGETFTKKHEVTPMFSGDTIIVYYVDGYEIFKFTKINNLAFGWKSSNNVFYQKINSDNNIIFDPHPKHNHLNPIILTPL